MGESVDDDDRRVAGLNHEDTESTEDGFSLSNHAAAIRAKNK
jgi:hypothetical protein